MPRDKTAKPKKPYEGYPLTPHANGQWCKKIRQSFFFGVWRDADAALSKYLDERDDLQAGRIPHRLSAVVVDVGTLANLFLNQWDAKVQSGSLSPRTFVDYRDCAKMLVEHLNASPRNRKWSVRKGWPSLTIGFVLTKPVRRGLGHGWQCADFEEGSQAVLGGGQE